MNNTTDFKALIWDMDGTIFDTERLIIDTWDEILNIHGYPNSRDVFLSCIGKNSRDANTIIMNHFGTDFPIDTLREKRNRLKEEKIKELGGIPIKDGIVESLAWASARGIPSALASSSDHSKVMSHLTGAGLETYFDVIVGGDEVTQGKPHPEIFLKAAGQLGIEPEHCIVFEDSHNGVIAADEAGMYVVMIPDLVPPNDEITARTDHMLNSGTEIIDLLSLLI